MKYNYKSGDVSEKLFRGDKSYLGNRSLPERSYNSAFCQAFPFHLSAGHTSCSLLSVLQIPRRSSHLQPHLTVPAAIRELEKIELVRQTDGKYRMDHAVTATQKIILKAFDMNADQIQDKAAGLSRLLEKYAEEGK